MRLRTLLVCSALFCLLFGVNAYAISGIEIGVKGGLIDNYNQPDLALGDYDINRLNLLGGQLYVSRLPVVDIIVAADYSWRNEQYDIAGLPFEFKLRDLAITASVVYPLSLSFVSAYAGVGIGSHSISYEYIKPLALSLADNGIAVPETSSYLGYHGLIGAKVSLPALPFGVFVEGRYAKVNTSGDGITFNVWSGGIFFALP